MCLGHQRSMGQWYKTFEAKSASDAKKMEIFFYKYSHVKENEYKIQGRFWLNSRGKYFTVRATGHWNNLPIKWWMPKCFDTSKIHVDHLFRPRQEKLDQINLKAPSNPSILILCRFSFLAKLHASVTIVHLPAYLLLQSIFEKNYL